jgi:hypothetical protein
VCKVASLHQALCRERLSQAGDSSDADGSPEAVSTMGQQFFPGPVVRALAPHKVCDRWADRRQGLHHGVLGNSGSKQVGIDVVMCPCGCGGMVQHEPTAEKNSA